MKMHSRFRNLALGGVLAVLLAPSALAQTEQASKPQVFGELYRTAPAAAPDQAQVIYFRPVSEAPKASGANVYIGGHFHTSLLPGGFTTFCLPPGPHLLGAYQHDAPLYRGKTEELYRVNLDAGKTYFVKVSEDGTGLPVSVEREEAEQSLRTIREQTHAISRASTPSCKSAL
jgi:OOP family OmpA-OmpF porin